MSLTQNRFFGSGCGCGPAGHAPAGGGGRRRFLAGAAAVLGGGLLAAGDAAAQPAAAPAVAGVVDIHHHVSPPAFLRALIDEGAGERPMLDWTLARSLEDMDRAGVATSITSITTPGVWFGDAGRARVLARACNDYGARLMADHPGRFGLFAALPLPDVEGSLREIEYALDVLRADGVGLMTSFGDKWLGDAAFTPVLEELNRRKAIVYTHPTTANCCRNLLPEVHYSVIELGTDTTRTIASLLFSGAAARFPDIAFIFSHAGGTMPFLAGRFAGYPGLDRGLGLGLDIAGKVPGGILPALRRFHYDTAQTAHPMAMSSLLSLVPPSQVLFGTDFPFRTAADHIKGLGELGLPAEDLGAIERGNALRLIPRLRA